jgi:hypothetical protein
MNLLGALAVLSVSLYGQAWSGVLDPSRAVDWSSAGVSGGIPSRSTISATLGTPSFGTVDSFVALTGATTGNTLTTGILNSGTNGTACTWALNGSGAMTVGASQGAMGGSINAGATLYPTSTTTHSLAFDNATNFTYVTCSQSSANPVWDVAGYVTFGPADAGGAGSLFDMVRIDSLAGGYAVLQLRNGTFGGGGCTDYCVAIETDGPTHSTGISVTPGSRYYTILEFNKTTGISSLGIYDPATFSQIGKVTVSQRTDGNPFKFYLGNAEVATSSGHTSYFEDFTVTSTPTFPTLPTQTSSTVQPVTATQINSALSSATAGSVVYLSPGIYNLSSAVVFGGSTGNGVTLRGAGANQTSLIFSSSSGSCNGGTSDICMTSADNNWKNSPSNSASWTAGYSKGTTTITLSSVSNLSVGNPIILDQCDTGLSGSSCATGTVTDNGSILVTDLTTTGNAVSPGITGPYSLSGNAGGAQRSGRQQEQIVTVTQCDGNSTPGHTCSSGSNITISPGLYMPNWASGNTPQAWWSTTPGSLTGVENLTVDNRGSSSAIGIEIYNCSSCWVKGVEDIDSSEAHVRIHYSPRTTVRDSYFFLTQNWTTASYGVEFYSGSDGLVENNITQAVASPYMFNGPESGSVLGYNFSINNFYNASLYNQNAHGDHTAGNDSALIEGNYGNVVNADVIHGTHNLITYFRNRYSGPSPKCWSSSSDTTTAFTAYNTATYGSCNNNLIPMVVESFSRFYNVVGNILGTTGTNTIYNTGTSTNRVYGYGGNGAVPDEPNPLTTIMAWGNCDSATGFNACRFNSNEVPSSLSGTQAAYSNPVPGSQTLPSSFYYSSKPSWWPSGKAWPAIGPDVSGGNISGVNGHAYTIPAQDCYLSTMAGASDGTGGPYSFNAQTCYGATQGGSLVGGPVTRGGPVTSQ